MGIQVTSTRYERFRKWASRLFRWTLLKILRAEANDENNVEGTSGNVHETTPLSVEASSNQYWHDWRIRLLRDIERVYDNGPSPDFWPWDKLSIASCHPKQGQKEISLTHRVTHDGSDKEEFHDADASLHFPFLSLPFEMRHEVFKHVLPPIYYTRRTRCRMNRTYITRNIYLRGLHDNPILNLMLTCRQLHTEISHALPNIVQIHVHSPKDLGLPGPDLRPHVPACMYTPFWYMPPALRQGQSVTGQWTSPWGESCPSIPLEILQQNSLKWRRVHMVANVQIEKAHDRKSFTERFEETLMDVRVTYRDIDEFIRFQTNDGLRVTVLLRFADKELGCHVCSLSVSNGNVTLVTRREGLPEGKVLCAMFKYVFDLD